MGKQVNQGTRYETRVTRAAREAGRNATRLPKTGTKHEPDVFITGSLRRPVVAWENWVKRPGQRRRATRMVTMTEAHFMELLQIDSSHQFGYHVQCKSTQTLSVRAVLEGLMAWMEK